MLKSGCAVTAVLAFPAGIILSRPAQAQTIIDVDQSATVNLSAYRSGNPFTITAGTTISTDASGGFSVSAPSSVPSLTNNGIILGNPASSHAVDLSAGGYINNTGTIYGADAVVSHEGGATVNNSGAITGYSGHGVSLSGSGANRVQNSAGGYILGGIDGILITSTNASVQNEGTITGNNLSDITASGIYLEAGGTVTNGAGGYVIALTNGIDIQGHKASIDNAGAIIAFGDGSDGTGIVLGTGGTVSNSGTGTIFGGAIGLELAAPGTVVNDGGITGVDTGINFAAAGNLTNAVTGNISGDAYGVLMRGRAGIANAGNISGGQYAVGLADGGTISGGIAVYATSHAASISNAGQILGGTTAVELKNGGELHNAAGGTISAGDFDVYTDVFSTVSNDGLIETGEYGIIQNEGGIARNHATGMIEATATGIYIAGSAGTVSNAGTIIGQTIGGVALQAGGKLSNSGIITGSVYGAELDGPGRIANAGTIIGNAGTGVILNGGTLSNAASGLIDGAALGLSAADGAAVINAGTIMDSLDAGASLGDHVSLTNTGLITGVTGLVLAGTGAHAVNAGTIASTDAGSAVLFSGTGDVLTLTTGAVLIGDIDGGGKDGQIVLAGSGTLTSFIRDFGEAGGLTVAPVADWSASGGWTIAAVTNAGMFQPGLLGTPLNLTGNFTQTPGGSLAVLVTPARSSQFNVSGSARLAGTVTYFFAPGTYAPKTYDFLTAGNITGQFARVVYAGYDPRALAPQTAAFGNAANLVLNEGGIVTPADDALFADTDQILAAGAQQANAALLGKAVQNTGGTCAAVAGSDTPSRLTAAIANGFCRNGGWIEATGAAMNADASGGGYKADTAGFLAGIDRPVNQLGTRLGLALGYGETWAQDGNGKSRMDTTRIGLYAAQPLGRFTLAASFMYGHADSTSLRATGAGQAEGKNGSDIFSGAAQISTRLAYANYSFAPAAGIRFATISAGGFTEQAAGIAAPFTVAAAASHYTSVQPFLRLDISRQFTAANALTITPDLSIGGSIEAADRGKSLALTAQDGTRYISPHTDLDAGMAQIGAGITAGRHNWSLYARYVADVSGTWTAQTGRAKPAKFPARVPPVHGTAPSPVRHPTGANNTA